MVGYVTDRFEKQTFQASIPAVDIKFAASHAISNVNRRLHLLAVRKSKPKTCRSLHVSAYAWRPTHRSLHSFTVSNKLSTRRSHP